MGLQLDMTYTTGVGWLVKKAHSAPDFITIVVQTWTNDLNSRGEVAALAWLECCQRDGECSIGDIDWNSWWWWWCPEPGLLAAVGWESGLLAAVGWEPGLLAVLDNNRFKHRKMGLVQFGKFLFMDELGQRA
eukprot:g38627.t1